MKEGKEGIDVSLPLIRGAIGWTERNFCKGTGLLIPHSALGGQEEHLPAVVSAIRSLPGLPNREDAAVPLSVRITTKSSSDRPLALRYLGRENEFGCSFVVCTLPA